jgi:hypothetical protein
MGALVVNMFTSLDGVLQSPGAPEEDREGGFAYGGWQAPHVESATFPKGAVLLTYERAGRPTFGSMA